MNVIDLGTTKTTSDSMACVKYNITLQDNGSALAELSLQFLFIFVLMLILKPHSIGSNNGVTLYAEVRWLICAVKLKKVFNLQQKIQSKGFPHSIIRPKNLTKDSK